MSTELDRCHRLFTELEAQRSNTLTALREWPEHRVSFRPAADSWCAIEVLDHVVRAEAGTIDVVQMGLQSPHILGADDRPGVAALDRALRSERKFQVPTGAGDIYPDADTTLAEVVNRWDLARAELAELLKNLTPAEAHTGVFCHPFAGWMTVREAMEHFSAHLYHHGFQLERLRIPLS